MNTIVENMTGMNVITDQIIASDLLIAAKAGVKNCAIAITETATPEVRTFLRAQLNEAVTTHEAVSNYMISKGWYHPYNIQEQIQLDMQNAQTALSLTNHA
jgi:similar to spore coat protein